MTQHKINDTDYKIILENIPICCVDIFIFHNDKILLIKRNIEPEKNKWWVPGGRIYKNETIENAIIRKAYEETGLNVKINKIMGVYETMFNTGIYEDLKTGTHTINICSLVEIVNNNLIRLDDTSSDYKWIENIDNSYHPYIIKNLKNLGF
jgi:colanic acid biosynthesis protein WcaH